MRVLTGIYKVAAMLVYSLYILYIALTKYKRQDSQAKKNAVAIYYNKKLLKRVGVEFRSSGQVPQSVSEFGQTESEHGMVVVSNHVSFIDIFSLEASCGCRFVSKAEIKSWPIWGNAASLIGTLFIDRSSRRAILQINEDMEKALERREVIGLFAEGTTTFGNSLLPIKANFFAPPAKLGSVIQPVVLVYTSNGVPTERVAFSGDVSLPRCLWNVVTTPNVVVTAHFLEPFSAAGFTRQQIGQICEERMRAFIKETWGDKYIETDPRVSEYLKKVTSKT